jgi:hypothetical protein
MPRWSIYKLAAGQTWIGEVDAATEAEAVEKAALEFKQYAAKLMAVPRGLRADLGLTRPCCGAVSVPAAVPIVLRQRFGNRSIGPTGFHDIRLSFRWATHLRCPVATAAMSSVGSLL